MGLRIKIGKLYSRNGILSLIARHGNEIVYHVSFQSVTRNLRLVGYLRIILVEVFGEINNRLLDELHIATTAYHHS